MAPAHFIKTRNSVTPFLFRLIDITCIAWVLIVSTSIYSVPFDKNYLLVVVFSCLSFLIFAEMFNLYRSWRDSLFSSLANQTFWSWVGSSVTVQALMFLIPQFEGYPAKFLVIASTLTCITLIVWRYFWNLYLKWLRAHGRNLRTVAILGVTDVAQKLIEEMHLHPDQGFKVVGFYENRSLDRIPSEVREKVIGNFQDAINDAKNGEFDKLCIALPVREDKRINKILYECGDSTVDVHLIPDHFLYNLVHSRVTNIGSMHTISVYESPYLGDNYWLKRLEDIVISSAILCLIAIPMLLIALSVKFTSKGPVIFKQHRYGLGGQHIKVYKFRTMTTTEDGDKVTQASKNDNRITPLGAFLRKTSLDELPQFINVLQGRMSIVGPRPHAVAHNEEYRKVINYYMLRHKVKPGITGWAQINGWRGETDTLDKMEKRIEYDLEYMRRWTIFLDLKIIVLTVFKGFVNKNAY